MTDETGTAIRRLYRSNEDRVIAGVCGGLGEYFMLDPVILRIIWIVITIVGGSGILLYILAWLLIPRRPYIGSQVQA